MKSASLIFNGKVLPDFCFADEIKYHLFFPFHFVFKEDFLFRLKAFSDQLGIKTLVMENWDPVALEYKSEIAVSEMPASFIDTTTTILDQNYINSEISIYMMTNVSVIYPKEIVKKAGMLLERGYDIAVLGSEDTSLYDFFRDVCLESIDEVISFMSVNFKNETVPIEIEKQMRGNWTDWADRV